MATFVTLAGILLCVGVFCLGVADLWSRVAASLIEKRDSSHSRWLRAMLADVSRYVSSEFPDASTCLDLCLKQLNDGFAPEGNEIRNKMRALQKQQLDNLTNQRGGR